MRKLLAILALVHAGATWAGVYHQGGDLKCSQCHAMHASRRHLVSGGQPDPAFPGGAPSTRLLIQVDVNQTCLACHDGQPQPDVFGADANQAWNRSAGALNGAVPGHVLGAANPASQKLASTGAVPAYADWTGHTLDSHAPPPGYPGASWIASGGEGFNCINCHAVHGSPAYRNLGRSRFMVTEIGGPASPFTEVGPTYVEGAVDLSKDVSIRTAGSRATADVVFGAGTGGNGMNAFCAVCHGNFHGDANTRAAGGADFIRHPTTGVVRLGTSYGSLVAGAQTDLVRPCWSDLAARNFEVGCLTCHKGHGNARAFGLLFPSNAGAVTDWENGDAPTTDPGTSREAFNVRSLCVTCHPMGR
jgi:hypothetical protein